MKHIFLALFFCFNLNLFSQVGTYTSRKPHLGADGTIIKWTLSLNQDGTFLYHFLRDIVGEMNPEENFYGKGIWNVEGKIVTFYAKPTDVNDEFSVDLNNSKARYITKSPRDKTDKLVKTALRFYESETFHIPGLELYKE
jgi:hypothetical protein